MLAQVEEEQSALEAHKQQLSITDQSVIGIIPISTIRCLPSEPQFSSPITFLCDF